MHLASRTDAEEAYHTGRIAVAEALRGASGRMVAINRLEGEEYRCNYELVDLDRVANQEKKVPRSWINATGNDITPDFIKYAQPLIQGEVNIPYHGGLPAYVNLARYPAGKRD